MHIIRGRQAKFVARAGTLGADLGVLTGDFAFAGGDNLRGGADADDLSAELIKVVTIVAIGDAGFITLGIEFKTIGIVRRGHRVFEAGVGVIAAAVAFAAWSHTGLAG